MCIEDIVVRSVNIFITAGIGGREQRRVSTAED